MAITYLRELLVTLQWLSLARTLMSVPGVWSGNLHRASSTRGGCRGGGMAASHHRTVFCPLNSPANASLEVFVLLSLGIQLCKSLCGDRSDSLSLVLFPYYVLWHPIPLSAKSKGSQIQRLPHVGSPWAGRNPSVGQETLPLNETWEWKEQLLCSLRG